ncbi:MAG TPA: ABC transporter permease, partial [Bacteroidales bacterium]|nr:ABC transporter permease [Bacteroidales bacterium]
MIRFKIKLALRNLFKNKLYSSLIIGGFAIGFTACILIALFYSAEHNVDKHFANYKNIYRLYDAKRNECVLDYKINSVLSENYADVKETCPVNYLSKFKMTLKDPETKNYTQVSQSIYTSNSFFDIFSVGIVANQSEKPFADVNSAVISESVAKRLFGDLDPLGRTIKEGSDEVTVTAVIKDLPENSSFKAEYLLNIENKDYQIPRGAVNGVRIFPTEHFVLLKNDVDPVQFAAKLNSTIGQYNSTTDSLAVQNLSDIYLSSLALNHDNQAKGNPKLLMIFMMIAILIIILSSINYLNYTVSLQYAKMKEIGINKTNGAGKGHLLLDSLIEVSMGVLVALLISFILASALLPFSENLFGRRIDFKIINVQNIILVFAGTVTGIILINSLAPLYILSKFNITDFLLGGKKRKGKQFGKQAMLTFQLTVSIALIAGVMFIFKQLQFVKYHDLGFDQEHLVRLDIPYSFTNPELVKDETARLPFVANNALSLGYPGKIIIKMGSEEDGKDFDVNCIYVSDNYLETMGFQLQSGRDFMAGDKGSACLMNQEAINQYGWDTVEGKKYNIGENGGYEVIGTVSNFNVASLHQAISPVSILYEPEGKFNTLSLRLLPGNVGEQMEQLQKVWKKILPDEPMEFTFYDAQFQAMYAKEDKMAKSITFFSFIAIVLTCMGILGQIFIISLNRTKEIGVRKVNGAKVSEILTMLNKDFVKWVGIAFIIAT